MPINSKGEFEIIFPPSRILIFVPDFAFKIYPGGIINGVSIIIESKKVISFFFWSITKFLFSLIVGEVLNKSSFLTSEAMYGAIDTLWIESRPINEKTTFKS